jgi:TolB-like protein/Tfp pilus assembly protein PilF
MSLIADLKQRKIVQWALAYAAAAFAFLQGVDLVAQRFGWPESIERMLIIAAFVGFLVTLILAWYHGERGAQHLSSTEVIVLSLSLALGGIVLWKFAPGPPTVASASTRVAKPAAAVPVADEKSIAVLPFENLSADKDNAYFSDGITEEILDALAQIPNLKVTARQSAFQFRGNDLDLRKIGRALGVARILAGSVQKSGDKVRINVRLSDARSGLQVWSQKYDRKLTSIFAIEDEISKAITDTLRLQLADNGGQPLVVVGTGNTHAHDLYLRGRALMSARAVPEAVDSFQQAVKLDPSYAQAWGALAEAYRLLPAYSTVDGKDLMKRAASAAQRALAIDPNVALAYVAVAGNHWTRMNFQQADQAYRQALALAPGDADVHNVYAQFLRATGQPEPALREIDRAQLLDPLSASVGANRAAILMLMRRDVAARAQLEITLAAHPDAANVHNLASVIYLDLGMYKEAEVEFRGFSGRYGYDADANALLVRGIADPKLRAAALRGLDTNPKIGFARSSPIIYAAFLMRLGEPKRALQQLEVAAEAPSELGTSTNNLWNRCFDPVRNDPRFKAVLAKLRLPYHPENGTAP